LALLEKATLWRWRRRQNVLEQVASEAGSLGQALAVPADVTDRPRCVRCSRRRKKPSAGRSPLQQRRDRRAGVPWKNSPTSSGRLSFRQLRARSSAPEAFKLNEREIPRAAHYQQRFDLGAHAATHSAPYTATKHAISASPSRRGGPLDGRAYDIACGQIDIGNAATEMTARHEARVLQLTGDRT